MISQGEVKLKSEQCRCFDCEFVGTYEEWLRHRCPGVGYEDGGVAMRVGVSRAQEDLQAEKEEMGYYA